MYKKNEQETIIHYDVLTGKTTFTAITPRMFVGTYSRTGWK